MNDRKKGGHQVAPPRTQATREELQQTVSVFKDSEQSLAALNAPILLLNPWKFNKFSRLWPTRLWK